jgi:hypothetical protein
VAKCGGAGWEKGLTRGTHMLVTEKEKRHFNEMRKTKGKTSFSEYAKKSWAGWAERGGGGLRGEAGWCEQAGLASLDPRRRFKWKFIFEFQMNLDFGKNFHKEI